MKKILGSMGNYLRTTDLLLILLALACSGMSLLLLGSLLVSGNVLSGTFKTQAVAVLLGFFCAIVLSKIDYRFIAKMWKLHVPLALALVGLTFVMGKQVSEYVDDKAWIEIFGVGMQPSEFLKISFIMSFAYHLSKVRENLNDPKHLILLCLHGGLPVLLIHFQGDDGTALIFALMFVIMLFAAGLSWKYVALACGAAAVALPVLWFFIMNNDQKLRVLAVFHPDDPQFETIFYQQYSGKISIGSGGVWGKGLFQPEYRYVPMMHNDFIYSFAGEAIGFVGCVLILLLLGGLCVRLLANAARCPDPLGQYVFMGVFAMFASQIIINVGMNLSLVPVIGVTLPFFSAGGSSVLSSYLGMGLALSVYQRNAKGLFSDGL